MRKLLHLRNINIQLGWPSFEVKVLIAAVCYLYNRILCLEYIRFALSE